MKIVVELVLLLVGFVMLVKGADWFVDGAAGIPKNVLAFRSWWLALPLWQWGQALRRLR